MGGSRPEPKQRIAQGKCKAPLKIACGGCSTTQLRVRWRRIHLESAISRIAADM